MILAYDTETTGLPLWNERNHDPRQPHLVQLALVQCHDDGREADAVSVIVRPDGWTIPDEVAAIHGITQERALDEGVPEREAVGLYVVAQGMCRLRVAHNEQFDRRIMRIAMTRAGFERDFIEAIEARAADCTCKVATPIVNLPPTNKMLAVGINRPKAASLAESIQHFFNEAFDNAHDALTDARACARIYFHMLQRVPTVSSRVFAPAAAIHWGDETA